MLCVLVDIMEPCHASYVVMVGFRAPLLFLALHNDVLVLSILRYVPPHSMHLTLHFCCPFIPCSNYDSCLKFMVLVGLLFFLQFL